jgi:hypothetical protein
LLEPEAIRRAAVRNGPIDSIAEVRVRDPFFQQGAAVATAVQMSRQPLAVLGL